MRDDVKTKSQDATVILPSDPDAATYRTNIEGWVSRHGRFWGDNEKMAREEGATHRICPDCGSAYRSNPNDGFKIACQVCVDKREMERYLALPVADSTETTVVYSKTCDAYYSSFDELVDSMFDAEAISEESSVDDIREALLSWRIVNCAAIPFRHIDLDLWEDALPDGWDESDFPEELVSAVDAVNEVITELNEKNKVRASFGVCPAKTRINYEQEAQEIYDYIHEVTTQL